MIVSRDNSDVVEPMEATPLYAEDWLGLRQLHGSGRKYHARARQMPLLSHRTRSTCSTQSMSAAARAPHAQHSTAAPRAHLYVQ